MIQQLHDMSRAHDFRVTPTLQCDPESLLTRMCINSRSDTVHSAGEMLLKLTGVYFPDTKTFKLATALTPPVAKAALAAMGAALGCHATLQEKGQVVSPALWLLSRLLILQLVLRN